MIRNAGMVVLLALTTGCPETPTPSKTTVKTLSAVRGRVTNHSGQPISNVAVVSAGAVASTDSSGRYQLKVPAGQAVVRFSKSGFVETVKRVAVSDGAPTMLHLNLLTAAAPVTLGVSGGEVRGSDGAVMNVPANAFVGRGGAAVDESVKVRLTNVDPTTVAVRAAASGSFMADSAGQQVQLESTGMMSIDVRDQTGQKLQVGNGAQLTLRMPVADGVVAPDPTMPLWSFDDTAGQWVSEGTAVLDTTDNTYVATVPHMSLWNTDRVYDSTCLAGCVVDENDQPLVGASVQADGVDYFGSSAAESDSSACFRVAVRKNSTVRLTAMHAVSGGTSQDVSTGSSDTTVPPTSSTACADAGVFRVQRDVYTYGDESTDCTALTANMQGDACQEEFARLSACFRPAGECTTTTESGTGSATFITTYGSGSSSVMRFDFSSGRPVSEYYGVDGELCYRTAFEQDEGEVRITWTPRSGDAFEVVYGDDELTVQCPGGRTFVVDGATASALRACSPEDSNTPPTQCLTNVPGSCAGAGDCTSTSSPVCCAFNGISQCFADAETCAQVDGGVLP